MNFKCANLHSSMETTVYSQNNLCLVPFQNNQTPKNSTKELIQRAREERDRKRHSKCTQMEKKRHLLNDFIFVTSRSVLLLQ